MKQNKRKSRKRIVIKNSQRGAEKPEKSAENSLAEQSTTKPCGPNVHEQPSAVGYEMKMDKKKIELRDVSIL